MWLAPVQIVVATITQEANSYAREVAAELKQAGLRVELDLRNEKVGYKVREHSLQKTPVIAVVGKKEAEARSVALRRFGGDAQSVLPLARACSDLAAEAAPPDLRG
jgi:threonyl-tRNA synthetase